ncbi:MAG: dUTP diphosphatase [bacterium]|nr:dUTP diphosphatase [bacterium]
MSKTRMNLPTGQAGADKSRRLKPNMKIKIKRFDRGIDLPKQHSEHAAAFDLCAREKAVIAPKTVAYVPLNIVVETPKGHFMLLAGRSSLHKRGLMSINGIGIIDPDYSGDEDEVKAALYNFTDNEVVVAKGDRIMQGLFIRAEEWQWDEVEKMPNKTRGGFGSTGHH